MSGSRQKKIRQIVKRHYKADVRAFLSLINESSLRVRFKLAWRVLMGKA